MCTHGPVFVVGAPRTGTTLVREILNRHRDVHLFDEIHFFERIWDDRERLGDLSSTSSRRTAVERLRRIVADLGCDAELTDAMQAAPFAEQVDRCGGGYTGLLAALLETGAAQRGARVGGDSSPQDVLYLETILSWFPGAKIVALVRDPRGFLSSYKNYYRRGVSTYRERYHPLHNSLLWRSYMNAVLEAEGKPWGGAVHRLRYEDLVTDPEGEVRKLCSHLGLEFHPDLVAVDRVNTSFVGAADRGPGIFADSKERWRTELTPTEVWIGERIFGEVMERFGYRREAKRSALPPSPVEAARILAILPGRLFNLLFRTHKPFKLSKLRRVVSLIRGG